jgi:alanyl-tRNA synthetase
VNAADIRQLYRDFFVAHGHQSGVPAGLVPAGDASVLFTTAGMQQYKPYYLGVETPPARRMTTCQRCFRTSDIENVGHTARHLTFFEMLGNFSFGDYFKTDAIAWALDLSDQLGLDRDRIWVSVFGGDEQVPADDEAIAIWKSHGVPEERIVRLGRGDNFWGPAGPTGPCGPCSELYYDFGPEHGCGRPDCAPGCECDRFIEYWNLVFVQYDMNAEGVLAPLPRPSIDTGMGLERIAAITQGVTTVFESDAFTPLIALAEELSGQRYGSSEAATRALRTIAEHARAVAFLIMDGVLPGNEGREYVLRRIIRRAVQQGVSIGLEEPFLTTLCARVVTMMKDAYPELVTHQAEIERVVGEEEVRFRRTLEQGTGILAEALRRAHDAGTDLAPAVAFELHDTYGFPFDLTREIAAEHGMSVDEASFEQLMSEQRERARAAAKGGEFEAGPNEIDAFQREAAQLPSTFVGYEVLEVFTSIRACRELADGRLALKLGESPFYAEGGGQSTDTGWIQTDGGKLEVEEVVRFVDDQVIVARVVEGGVSTGERAKAMVNAVRRHQTACNHTATHLLHNALRLVLGDGVRQAGSAVRQEKLRFDYTTRRAPTTDELRHIEELVNRRIVENHPVRPFVTTREYAAELGALAFFEEKYGEFVRVLEIDDFSRELCGGTHVSSTAQIGIFKITASSSVGANTRRIEAITSAKGIEHYRAVEATALAAAADLGVAVERLPATVQKLREQLAELKAQVKAGLPAPPNHLSEVLAGAQPFGGAQLVAAVVDGATADELLELADGVRAKLTDVVAILLTAHDGRVAAVVAVSDSLTGRGVHAQQILQVLTPHIDGKGGGRPNLARGGGSNVAGMAAARDAAAEKVRELLA